jgi:hypothetical protein
MMIKNRRASSLLLPLLVLPLSYLPPRDAEATRKSALATAVDAAIALQVLYGVQVPETGVAGGLLRPGQGTAIRAQLVKGVTYIFVAGGCKDAHDVDLVVYDAAGELLTIDTSLEKFATSAFVAPYTGEYILLIGMARSTGNGAHWVLVMGEG